MEPKVLITTLKPLANWVGVTVDIEAGKMIPKTEAAHPMYLLPGLIREEVPRPLIQVRPRLTWLGVLVTVDWVQTHRVYAIVGKLMEIPILLIYSLDQEVEEAGIDLGDRVRVPSKSLVLEPLQLVEIFGLLGVEEEPALMNIVALGVADPEEQFTLKEIM